MTQEIQLTNGDRIEGNVTIKANGWVRLSDDGGVVNYPPRKVERVDGDATHQSPHGRI